MSCYFVAQIKVNDREEYKKYLNKANEVFSKYNGKYLVADTSPEVLEGSWSYSRVIIIQFPEKKDLRDWYESTEYQKILKHRLKAANCDTLLVKGID